MPTYKRKETAKLWQQLAKGDISQIYLLHGDRYLCRQVAEELLDRLVPDKKERKHAVVNIDGDQEDPTATLNLIRTYSLFGNRQIIKITDSKLFLSRQVGKSLWEKARQSYEEGDAAVAGKLLSQLMNIGAPEGDITSRDLLAVSAAKWKNLFGFAKPSELEWINDVPLQADDRTAPPSAADISELYAAAFSEGLPPNNLLILLAPAVDKRKKLFKFIEQNQVVIDLAVDSGYSAAARKEQDQVLAELIRSTLSTFHKKVQSDVITALINRTGYHPDAVAMETEKLALSVGDKETITLEDLNTIVSRTKEDAIFEFNEAVSAKNLPAALAILARMLQSGMHPLAIVAGMRNHIRKLLLVRSYQELKEIQYPSKLSYPVFQKTVLPALKTLKGDNNAVLSGHPYAVFMQFQRAESFTLTQLKNILKQLLEAEYRLKGSGLPDILVLENLLYANLL